MRPIMSGARIGLAPVLLAALAASCGVDATSNTGIRINVTLHEVIPDDDALGLVDTLRFYVAVEHPEGEVFLLNGAASGIVVDVTDRDLRGDPYQLLVSRGGAWMKRIRVVVVGERNGVPVLFGQLSDPATQEFFPGQVVQRTIDLLPPEQSFDMSWTENGCLISSTPRNPDYEPFAFGSIDDKDCDGWDVTSDCDDLDSRVNPGVEEGYDCDGVDNDCDGLVDPGGSADFDEDGFTACEGDCDDNDPEIHPGAAEVCDARDNDCDGKCDNAEDIDVDRDGYANCGDFGSVIDHATGSCRYLATPDCDDANPGIHPDAEEICNGRDDNCDGRCDEGQDPDGDGYTACGSKNPTTDPIDFSCIPLNPSLEDCDPENPDVYPTAPELCDGLDNNCDDLLSDVSGLCHRWGPSQESCWDGTAQCREGNAGDLWGSCDNSGAEVPLDRCGVWSYCKDSPDPAACVDLIVTKMDMTCHLHFPGSYSAGLCGMPADRGVYYLPFGFSGNQGCTWQILLDPMPSTYDQVGLVNVTDLGADPAVILYSCEAALVVEPNAFLSESPGTLTGVISFFYDNGGGDFYALELPFSVTPVTACDPATPQEGLTCDFP